MNKAKRLQYQLNRFVEKLGGVNKPFQALKKSPEYHEFHDSFKTAIATQLKWAAEHVGEITRHPDVAQYVNRNMPVLKNHIKQDNVVAFYKHCFEWGVAAQYQRLGIKLDKSATGVINKAVAGFTLTNQNYLDRINDNSSYLLNKSSIDDTTRNKIIGIIQAGINHVDDEGADDPLTNDVIGQSISDQIDAISSSRADMIARTESASAMADGDMASMQENNVGQYDWVAAGDNPCPICEENEDNSPYDVDDTSAPDLPAHPNCECYRQADPDSIDLDSMSIWDGS